MLHSVFGRKNEFQRSTQTKNAFCVPAASKGKKASREGDDANVRRRCGGPAARRWWWPRRRRAPRRSSCRGRATRGGGPGLCGGPWRGPRQRARSPLARRGRSLGAGVRGHGGRRAQSREKEARRQSSSARRRPAEQRRAQREKSRGEETEQRGDGDGLGPGEEGEGRGSW